ncbi:hypothetical protein BDR07DRAFT_1386151 [Suillus spraguei]|nr:hypothetical protein BDR07DRAFT_1386151 [Suillus spraguei]
MSMKKTDYSLFFELANKDIQIAIQHLLHEVANHISRFLEDYVRVLLGEETLVQGGTPAYATVSLIREWNVRRHSAPTTSLVKSQATTFVVESTSNLEVPKEPQSIPAAPELLHPKNIENAELNIQGSSLCELIISRIWNGGDGPEVEV